MAEVPPLTSQMIRLRRLIRALALARGLGWWLVTTIAAGLLLIGFDYLARVPAEVRVALAVVWLGLLAIASWRWLAVPLWCRIALSEVATAVDRRLPGSQDRMVTGIELSSEPRSPMIERVVHEAEAQLSAARKQRLLSGSRSLGPLALGLACMGVAVTLAALLPAWMSTGVRRYVRPLRTPAWPRWVEIVPLTGDQVAAMGEPVEVVMHLQRGDRRARPAWVVQDCGGAVRRELMLRRDDGRYSYRFPAVATSFRYWFESGDDSTAGVAGRVQVYRRPEIVRARLLVEPPAYAHRPAYAISLDDRRAEALAGSRLTLTLWISGPLATRPEAGGGPAAGLRAIAEPTTTAPAEAPPVLRFAGGRRDSLEARFDLARSIAFRLELRDEHGLASADDRPFTVAAVGDQLPSVKRIEPASPAMLTAVGRVEIVLEARDDIGLSALRWCARDASGRVVSSDWSELLPKASSQGGELARVRQWWSPTELQPKAGDIITCWAEVTDNYEVGGKRHAAVKSEPLEVRVVGPEELAQRLETDAAALQSWLRQLVQQQDELQRRTRAARVTTRPAEAARITSEQAVIAARTRELAARYARLLGQAQNNQLGPHAADLAARLDASQKDAAVAADRPMQAAADLARAGKLEASEAAQQQALAQMRSLLDRWGELASAQELGKRAQELLGRQQVLSEQTAQVPNTTDPAARENSEADRNRLAHAQRELAADAQRELARLNPSKPAGSQPSSEDAERIAPQDIPQAMRAAGETIRAGNMDSARELQKAAEAGLRDLLKDLGHDPKRQLAELSKKNADAQARLRELIAAETALLADIGGAVAAGRSETLQELREPQSVLRARTRLAAEAVGKADASGAAGGLVNAAAEHMGKAADALVDADGSRAQASGRTAVDALTQALETLAKSERQNQRQLAALALEELRATLAAIRGEQARINEATLAVGGGLAGATRPSEAAGALLRVQSRPAETQPTPREARLTELSGAQRGLADRMHALRPQLAKVAVSGWLVSELRARMLGIAKDLAGLVSEPRVHNQQKEVLARLDMLLQSLAEPPGDYGYETGQEGGDSDGSKESSPPVPRMAELKLLRALQADLLERTRRLHAAGTGASAAEAERLGREQIQLRKLAGEVLAGGQR